MPPRMPDPPALPIHIRDVQKDYRALRPLRVRELDVHDGESVALLGFDRAAAEVFVNLLTAATVPDSGRIEIFGRPTVDIQDADTWLSSLDCFGIVSDRQVLIDNMTVEENLTMPLTMALHDVDSSVRAKVAAIAEEVGLSSDQLRQPVTALGPDRGCECVLVVPSRPPHEFYCQNIQTRHSSLPTFSGSPPSTRSSSDVAAS